MTEWTRDKGQIHAAIQSVEEEIKACREIEHGCSRHFGTCDTCTVRLAYRSALKSLTGLLSGVSFDVAPWTRRPDLICNEISDVSDAMRGCPEATGSDDWGCSEWEGACDTCTTRIDYLSPGQVFASRMAQPGGATRRVAGATSGVAADLFFALRTLLALSGDQEEDPIRIDILQAAEDYLSQPGIATHEEGPE